MANVNHPIKETISVFSNPGAMRGLHTQTIKPMAKLMQCIYGKVYYAMVDVRPGSLTFGQYFSCYLSADNPRCILSPEGVVQGYMAILPSIVTYKASEVYYPEGEVGIKYNDKEIDIPWPFEDIGGEQNLMVSEKDKNLMSFQEYKKLINERTISL